MIEPGDRADERRDGEGEQRNLGEAPPRHPPQLDRLGRLDTRCSGGRFPQLVDVDGRLAQRPSQGRAEGGRLEIGDERGEPIDADRVAGGCHRAVAPHERRRRREQLGAIHQALVGAWRDRRSVELDEADLVAHERDGLRIDAVVRDPGSREPLQHLPASQEHRLHAGDGEPDERSGRIVEDEQRVARIRLRRDDHLVRRYPCLCCEERDERLVLDRIETAHAEPWPVASIEHGAPELLEKLCVVGVAPVDLDHEVASRSVRPAGDEDAGGLTGRRLKPGCLNAERAKRGEHVSGLRVAGRGSDHQPDDGCGNHRREQRGEPGARGHVLGQDCAEQAEHQGPTA